jgi:hypothetical protein
MFEAYLLSLPILHYLCNAFLLGQSDELNSPHHLALGEK